MIRRLLLAAVDAALLLLARAHGPRAPRRVVCVGLRRARRWGGREETVYVFEEREGK